jgi:hypothetical protein
MLLSLAESSWTNRKEHRRRSNTLNGTVVTTLQQLVDHDLAGQ